MPLVPAKCTICGAVLKIESDKEAAVCQYCGNAFIVEKAINHYNTYNSVVNNVTADAVFISQESEKEQLNKNAETYIKLGNLPKALSFYNQLVEKYPDDYRGWWGLIYYRDWSELSLDLARGKLASDLNTLEKLAPPDKYLEFKRILEERLEKHKDKLAKKEEEKKTAIRKEIYESIDRYENTRKTKSYEIENAQQEYNRVSNELPGITTWCDVMENKIHTLDRLARIIEKLHLLAFIVTGVIAALAIYGGVDFFLVIFVSLIIGLVIWGIFIAIFLTIAESIKSHSNKLMEKLKTLRNESSDLSRQKYTLDKTINKLNAELTMYKKRIAYMKMHTDTIVEAMQKKDKYDSYAIYDFVSNQIRS